MEIITREQDDRANEIDCLMSFAPFWEERFPGKGILLAAQVGNFRLGDYMPMKSDSELHKWARRHAWKPELKPASPKLVEWGNEAVFWRKTNGLIVLQSPLAADAMRLLLSSLEQPLDRSLEGEFETRLRQYVDPHSWDRLWSALWDFFGKSFWQVMRTLLHEQFRLPRKALFFDAAFHEFDRILRESLRDTAFYACILELADMPEEAAKFRPLLNLWLAGNFPLGVDREGNLLVLVSD